MADEIKLEAQFPDTGSFFDSEQGTNFLRGVVTNKDGLEQWMYSVGETLGLNEAGTQEYYTNKANNRMQKYMETRAASLPGADIVRLTGEIAPWMLAPTGTGSIGRGALIGSGIGASIFDPDPNASRIDNALIGAGIGGLFGKLSAPKQVQKHIDELESNPVLALPAPNRPALPPPPRPALSSPSAARLGQQTDADIIEGVFRVIDPEGLPGKTVNQRRLPAPQGTAPTRRGVNLLEHQAPLRSGVSKNVSREEDKAWKELAEAKIFQKEAEISHSWQKLAKMEKAADKLTKSSSKAARAQAIAMRAAARKEREELAREKFLTKIIKSELGKGRGRKKADPENPAMAAALQQAVGRPTKDPNLKKGSVPKKTKEQPRNQAIQQAEDRVLDDIDADELANIRNQALPPNLRGRQGRAQSGEIDPRLLAVAGGGAVGGLIGGAASDGDPVAIAGGALAGAFGGGALARGGSRESSRFFNKEAARKPMRDASRQASNFKEEVAEEVSKGNTTKEKAFDVITRGKKVLDEFLGSVDTRISNISTAVGNALRETEFRTHQIAGNWLEQANPLLKSIEKMKLSDKDMVTAKSMLLTNRNSAAAWLRKKGENEAANAIDELGYILDDVKKYMQDAGYNLSWREGYFPRQVVDTSFFKNIEEVQTHLQYLAKQKGAKLTPFEEEEALTKLMLGAINGKSEHVSFGRAAKALKKRKWNTVFNERVNAYADPMQGFNNYIEEVVRQVERQRFLKGRGVNKAIGANGENLDSAAKIIAQQLKKEGVDADQADELANLIRLRFGPGEMAPQRWIQNFKNFTYTGLLGNPIAALTQVGDIALSAHRNGIANTATAVVRALANGRQPIRNGLDKQSLLGLRDAAQDFASNVKTRDLLDWSLKYSGFRFMDRLGKNTFINAAMLKNQKLSREAFKERWGSVFGRETDKLYDDVINFQGINKNNRDNIGLMLWNELSGVQPISLSTLPQRYLQHPDGRMSYMLQSFTLRMFNTMREDIWNQAKNGQYKTAVGNAVKLSGLFTLLNGNVDMAKDFLRGKNDEEVMGYFVNAYLKMFGLSKYTVDSIGREGLGSALVKTVAPPTAVVDALGSMDKAAGLLPIVGPNLREIIK